MFEIEDVKGQAAKIKVVGVGGAGGNAINNMIASNIQGVEFVAVNTDMQVLDSSLAGIKVQIGNSITRGLGAGADPHIGKQAALEDRAAIAAALEGADMVFITAGMGGGTGTGASPVVAGIARELGALTVAVVTKPFFFEAETRAVNAAHGIKELSENVDTFIVIPNDRIASVVDKKTPSLKAFAVANDILRQAVQGISDIILVPGYINVDFADVKTIMLNAGRAVMGIGVGRGECGAVEAAKKAISNPLLEESSIEGAKGVLINITGGLDLAMEDVQKAAAIMRESAHKGVNVIFGLVIDPDINDEVRVTVIATAFDGKKAKTEISHVKKWPASIRETNFKGSERVLAKNLMAGASVAAMSSELIPYEEPHDTPTFLRKIPQNELY